MTCNAVDRLLKLCASLHAHGPSLPGKPPAFRPQVPLSRRRLVPVVSEDGHVIAYSRARCGATQTQTRSVRLDAHSPLDVAAAAGMARFEPELAWLLEYISGDQSRARRLRQTMGAELVAEAARSRWQISPDEATRVADLVLELLVDAEGCTGCATTGVTLDAEGRVETCPLCRGTGHRPLPERAVAARWGLSRSTYRRRLAPAVDWLHAVAQGRVAQIYERVREAMG